MSNRTYNRTLWQDRNVLMHWPRAAFVYCFLTIGAFLSGQVQWDRLVLSFVGMFFVLQLAAYRLDELKGRHCSTNLSEYELKLTIVVGLFFGGLVGLVAVILDYWMLVWLIVGFAGVILYNYEIAGFHNMWFFGITWGFAPLCANHWFMVGTITPEVLAWGVMAIVFARLHIWSYGNTICYHAGTCEDFGKKVDRCHGQWCWVRIEDGQRISRDVHVLQWHLVNLQLYLVLVLTAVVVLGYYF